MTEIDVTLTDYALTVICSWFSWKVRDHKVWLIFFSSVAVASLAGGTVHGFFHDSLSLGHRILWPTTMLAIGITASSAWVLGGLFLFVPSRIKQWATFSGLLFLFYAMAVMFYSKSFALVILNYLPAMVFMLLGAGFRYWRAREMGLRWIVGGLIVGFVAAAIQALRIAVHPYYFDHNSTYHVVQGVGLWMMYVGARALILNKKARTHPR